MAGWRVVQWEMNGDTGQHRRRIADAVVVCAAFFSILAAILVYGWLQRPVYQSVAKLEWHPDPSPTGGSVNREPPTRERLKDIKDTIRSDDVIAAVVKRLTPEERTAFLQPFGTPSGSVTAERVMKYRIHADHRARFAAGKQTVHIEYSHPDRIMAARVAKLMMEEVIAGVVRRRIDRELALVEDLKLRAEKQEQRVNEAAFALSRHRERPIRKNDGAAHMEATYLALKTKLAEEETLLRPLIEEMRDITMGSFVEAGWSSGERPWPGDAKESSLFVGALFWAGSWKR